MPPEILLQGGDPQDQHEREGELESDMGGGNVKKTNLYFSLLKSPLDLTHWLACPPMV